MNQLNLAVTDETDDIRSLVRQLDTGDFNYVDIASRQAWQQDLDTWPLLAEWDEWSKENIR